MSDLDFWVQWVACGLGLTGALLLATNGKYARFGWLFFLGSNAGWITYSVLIGSGGLAVQQIGFSVTSGIGIYQWFVRPIRASGSP